MKVGKQGVECCWALSRMPIFTTQSREYLVDVNILLIGENNTSVLCPACRRYAPIEERVIQWNDPRHLKQWPGMNARSLPGPWKRTRALESASIRRRALHCPTDYVAAFAADDDSGALRCLWIIWFHFSVVTCLASGKVWSALTAHHTAALPDWKYIQERHAHSC